MKYSVNPNGTPDVLRRYEYSVFDLCEQLHMDITGSGTRLTDAVRGKYMAALAIRIGTWITDPKQELYDNAVKALIVATLKEQEELP